MLRTAHPDGKAWVAETLWEAGALLAGRGLYTSWLGYWPTSDDPIAAPMNAIPKIAFSRSGKLDRGLATPPGWDDTRVLGTDLAADITALKAEPGKDLVAQGGASFGRSLVGLGLIDEYRLVIHPVILGSGLPLFRDATPFDLALTDVTTFPSGTQALVYQPK
jgi:dihydrofolate reductase